jgi:hypothetical protein
MGVGASAAEFLTDEEQDDDDADDADDEAVVEELLLRFALAIKLNICFVASVLPAPDSPLINTLCPLRPLSAR